MAERTVGDVFNGLTKRQKNCLYEYVGLALDGIDALLVEKERTSFADRHSRYRHDTVKSLDDEQYSVFRFFVDEALKQHSKEVSNG